MTSSYDPQDSKGVSTRRLPNYWRLQDAKARFSELVRRVRSEGPQRVSVRGRDEVVVLALEEYERLRGALTGVELVAALQAAPIEEGEAPPASIRPPVRPVEL